MEDLKFNIEKMVYDQVGSGLVQVVSLVTDVSSGLSFCKIEVKSSTITDFDFTDLTKFLDDQGDFKVDIEFIDVYLKGSVYFKGDVNSWLSLSFISSNLVEEHGGYQISPESPKLLFNHFINNNVPISIKIGISVYLILLDGDYSVESEGYDVVVACKIKSNGLNYFKGYFTYVSFIKDDYINYSDVDWSNVKDVLACRVFGREKYFDSLMVSYNFTAKSNSKMFNVNDMYLLIQVDVGDFVLRYDFVRQIENLKVYEGLFFYSRDVDVESKLSKVVSYLYYNSILFIGLFLLFVHFLDILFLYPFYGELLFGFYESTYVTSGLYVLFSLLFGFVFIEILNYISARLRLNRVDVDCIINFASNAGFSINNLNNGVVFLGSKRDVVSLKLTISNSNPKILYFQNIKVESIQTSADCFEMHDVSDYFKLFALDERIALEVSKKVFDDFSKKHRDLESKGLHVNYLNNLRKAAKGGQRLALKYAYWTNLYGYSWVRALQVFFCYIVICYGVFTRVYQYCDYEGLIFIYNLVTFSEISKSIKSFHDIDLLYNGARVGYGLVVYQLIIAFRKAALGNAKDN